VELGLEGFFFWVCPAAIMSMALDNATVGTAIFVWAVISTSNAILYALVGMIVAFLLNLVRSIRP
jgi:hypothetical protein